MLRDRLLGGVSYLPLRAPDGEGAGGGGAGGAAPAAAALGAPAGTATPAAAVAPAAVVAPAAKPASVLDTPAPEVKQEAKPAVDPAAKPADDPAKLKPAVDETAEQKVEREKAEAEARKVETLKSYEALKLPESVNPADPAFTGFKETAALHGLAPEVAQALVDSVAPKLDEAVNGPIRQWQKQQEDWIAADKADPEFGGKDFAQNMAIARKGVNALLGEEGATKFLQVAAFTGAGNSPEFVRACFRLGKMAGENGFVTGRTAPVGKPKVSELFYPPNAGQEA